IMKSIVLLSIFASSLFTSCKNDKNTEAIITENNVLKNELLAERKFTELLNLEFSKINLELDSLLQKRDTTNSEDILYRINEVEKIIIEKQSKIIDMERSLSKFAREDQSLLLQNVISSLKNDLANKQAYIEQLRSENDLVKTENKNLSTDLYSQI